MRRPTRLPLVQPLQRPIRPIVPGGGGGGSRPMEIDNGMNIDEEPLTSAPAPSNSSSGSSAPAPSNSSSSSAAPLTEDDLGGGRRRNRKARKSKKSRKSKSRKSRRTHRR